MVAEVASTTLTKISNVANSALTKLTNTTSSLVEKVIAEKRLLIPSLAIAATALLTQTWAFSQNRRIPMSPFGLDFGNRGNGAFSDQPPETIHLVVLVHGWLGNELEMNSIQQALEAEIEKLKTEKDENPEASNKKLLGDDTMFVFHSCTCNAEKGKTTDGIEAGGSRVAEEVNQLIERLLETDSQEDSSDDEGREKTLTLSFIGNSLGGLYARACVANINWNLPDGSRVIPNVFCTTATPHLGKRGLTYLPLPRFAEEGIGHALRPTGQDLFGITNIIERLATDPKYINPLQQFSKRIAYANAFGTDLQVPTATAAFLSDTDSLHITLAAKEPFVLTVETPRNDEVLKSAAEIALNSTGSDHSHIPASIMARVLDAMGWTKGKDIRMLDFSTLHFRFQQLTLVMPSLSLFSICGCSRSTCFSSCPLQR